MSVERVFRVKKGALDAAGVPYMVTGSLASSAFGEPRASEDIDIVIAPTRDAGLRLSVATAEDTVISKLEWAKEGESQRQVEDAAGILRVQADHLDTAYIERWVRELGLSEQWVAAKAQAR